jgi:hypothetical protein
VRKYDQSSEVPAAVMVDVLTFSTLAVVVEEPAALWLALQWAVMGAATIAESRSSET